MTRMTMGLLLVGTGCLGLLASPPPSSAFSPMLTFRLKVTHWLILLSGIGLIAHKLMPLRNADDLAIQEVVLGPLVTMVGILGLWLHGAMRLLRRPLHTHVRVRLNRGA